MEDKKTRQPILIDIEKVRKAADEPFLPLWFFQHDDLINAIDAGSRIKKENLINTLNRIHFMGDSICTLLRHPRYDEAILVKAIPETIEKDELTCSWDKSHTSFSLETFQFSYLIVMDQQSIILIPAKLLGIDSAGFKVLLPEESYVISKRVTNRFPCRDVKAELTQSGFLARGSLIDFSPQSFRIRIIPEMPSSHHCFNPDTTITARLTSESKMLFSGVCHCIRQNMDADGWEIVLAPVSEIINRFQARKRRHPRRQIFPPPVAVFEHPFSKKKIQITIFDISTTGFSVYEGVEDGVLAPGLVINGLSIIYAGELKMNCIAQVIYRKKQEENKVCCGLAILDMDIHSYSRLNRILTLNLDHHSFISTEVDMDALWEFFFDTGFIYPKKYKLLQDYKEEFKNIYKKLYQDCPEIARHITHEENGRIYGHLSMLRAYDRGWLIHHHAARPMGIKRPGLMVLKQMVQFLAGMMHLPSATMDSIMTYYRPENKFPDRVFGGFARELKNPRICSLDLFSYITFPVGTSQHQLPRDWSLHESTQAELWELEQFYKHSSGGLLLDVLNLSRKNIGDEPLEDVALRLGFLRKLKAYSLVHEGRLKAVLIVNQSDVGVNLSELLNSIKALIVDPENLPWEVLSAAVSQLTVVYPLDSVPLMVYPSAYSDLMKIYADKKYQMWILNTSHYPNEFLDYLQHRFQIKL